MLGWHRSVGDEPDEPEGGGPFGPVSAPHVRDWTPFSLCAWRGLGMNANHSTANGSSGSLSETLGTCSLPAKASFSKQVGVYPAPGLYPPPLTLSTSYPGLVQGSFFPMPVCGRN